MKAKLVVEGKEFEIEILDPKLQELVAPVKKTGYERATKENSTYYFDNSGGYVGNSIDLYPETAGNNAYKAANYYTSKQVAESNVRADKLMRQLRRFAVEHRASDIVWDYSQNKYYIFYDHENGQLHVGNILVVHEFGTIYFNTEAAANLAIEVFYDELIWYFTEYKDSL